MNIMMVGHGGAGKTAFMAALYRYYGEKKSGYGIFAENEAQRQNLKRMANNLANGIYPKQTDVQSQYKFSFTIDGLEVMPFNWMDYRGGLLSMLNPTEQEKDNFLAALRYADALIVFLDGEKISDSSNRWNNEYHVLFSCIQCAIREKRDHIYPICFVITKCDAYDDVSHGLSYFQPLLEQIKLASHVEAMVMRSIVNQNHFSSPAIALSYCIYRGIPFYKERREAALLDAQKRLKDHQPDSLLGLIGSVFEEMIQGVFEIFDEGWETELDLANYAKVDINIETDKLKRLDMVYKYLDEKIREWVKNGDLKKY